MVRLRFLILGLVLPLCMACTSTGLFAPRFVAGEPWELPPEAFPTQRLFRVKYQGPEGRAGFKLSLYLETGQRYRMQASDSLGRKLWSLDLDASGLATWLDHRQKSYCHTIGSQLGFVPLARLPLVALPKLLLGRLPTVPAAEVRRSEEGDFAFLDASGQRFSGSALEDGLQWWTLEEDGELVAWWRREEEGGTFVHRRTQQQVRWREVVREPLAKGLEALRIPVGYGERDCAFVAGTAAG